MHDNELLKFILFVTNRYSFTSWQTRSKTFNAFLSKGQRMIDTVNSLFFMLKYKNTQMLFLRSKPLNYF